MKNQKQHIELCAACACTLEVTACKPGNVQLGKEFPNLKFIDFIRSAGAIAPVMGRAPGRPIGVTILEAIQETRKVVKTNTNLGIVLLLAPLAAVEFNDDIPSQLRIILDTLTLDDAVKTYQAIRLVEPGGLGEVANQDVSAEPTVTLRDAMSLAADRDLIAAQYLNNFAEVFAGVNWLKAQLASTIPHPEVEVHLTCPSERLERLVVNLYFWLLARNLDSLVVRKRGIAEAKELQSRIVALLNAPNQLRERHLRELQHWFDSQHPHRNPGTTADLVCASLFVALRTGIIPLPEIPDEYLKEP